MSLSCYFVSISFEFYRHIKHDAVVLFFNRWGKGIVIQNEKQRCEQLKDRFRFLIHPVKSHLSENIPYIVCQSFEKHFIIVTQIRSLMIECTACLIIAKKLRKREISLTLRSSNNPKKVHRNQILFVW